MATGSTVTARGAAIRSVAARAPRAGVALLLLLPGLLTAYLSFNSGGYFPGATAVAALVLALALVVRAILAEDPLAGLGLPAAGAAAALMLLGVWILMSGGWSDAPARSLLELNRLLAYLLAVLLFGSLVHEVWRLRVMLWGAAASFTAVCTAGLATRLLPDEFTIAAAVQNERLSHPIGYWNALGLMAALAIVLCVHLASSEREPPAARAAGAAALPILAATLLFTFSRAPLAVAIAGIVLYLVLARPRGFAAALIAAGPATAVALVAAYNADLLATKEPTIPAAAEQGHDVALVVALCALVAAVLRLALVPLDRRLDQLRLEAGLRRRVTIAATATAAVAAIVVAVAADLPGRIDTQFDRFTRGEPLQTGDARERLTNPGINRVDQWEISLDAFSDQPLRGRGAGTFALLWDRDRPTIAQNEEGHSLYLETMGELGLVGIVLIAAVLLLLLGAVAVRLRGPNRSLYAAVLAAGLVWALHAGIDWDWEIPAVTLWLFALAALAGARAPAWVARGERAASIVPASRRRLARVVVAGACVVLAATPALVAVSHVRLRESVDAYEGGDCERAAERARASIDVLGTRPEPWAVLAYCAGKADLHRLAESSMRAAVRRDPDNWEYRYGLGLLRAGAGRDPRPALRSALQLNPREARTRDALARLGGNDPRGWRAEAREIGLGRPPGS